jgi:hypothetical protein
LLRPILIGALIAGIAIAALIAIRPGGSDAGNPVAIQGDADCNRTVDVRDAVAVLGYAAGGSDGGCAPSEGNVNCDDAVDATDSLMLVTYSSGLASSGGYGCAGIGEAVEPDSTAPATDSPTPPALLTDSPSPTETTTATPPPDGESGISGIAQEGPMCPVERENSPCPERPVANAPIPITDGKGSDTTVYTDEGGRFGIAVPPGDYEVQPMHVGDSGFPQPGPPQTVTVDAGQYTDVVVEYDSGIR